MRKHTKLLRDPYAYAESIGRRADDRKNLLHALETDGRDSIVRVCFSMPHRYPPIRALGYVAAAIHITETYLPEAQLQLVATVHANERINHTPLDEARAAAHLLFDTVTQTPHLAPRENTDVVYGFDMPHPPETPVHRIIPIMRHEAVSQQLARSAAARNAQYTEYVGAHLTLHDSVGVVEPATDYSATPMQGAETLISIGAQSERAFYIARHLCKSALFFTFPGMIEDTAQIFTRHVYPPYAFLRRDTRNMFDPVLTSQDSLYQLDDLALDPNLRPTSVQRDLRYLKEYLAYKNPDQ